MPQPEHHQVGLGCQQINILGLVSGIACAIAIELYTPGLVNDGDLNNALSICLFRKIGALLSLCPPEILAAGHPSTRFPFPKNNRVELVASLNRQDTTASLRQIVQCYPRNERLVGVARRGPGLQRQQLYQHDD